MEGRQCTPLEEEKRWRQRLAGAEADRNRVEAELYALRTREPGAIRQPQDAAQEIVSSHHQVKQKYDKELRQAGTDQRRSSWKSISTRN